jgi:hypothetical protein
LAECVATANVTERLKFDPSFVVPYNVGDQSGRTYLQASVYNLHAIALYQLDQKAEAKTYFVKAVSLDSNFVLAKQNLDAMLALEKNPVKLNSTNTPNSPGNKQN